MIRYIFLLIVTFISVESSGQSGEVRFDKGVGNFESYRTGHSIVRFIQRNNPNELLKFYKDTSTLNMNYLETQVDSISKAYTYSDSTQPVFYSEDSESTFYYERNFCHYAGNRIIIDLQVHIELYKEGDHYYIKHIQFRRDKEIVRRAKETKYLLLLGNDENPELPPPPPPPPPIR